MKVTAITGTVTTTDGKTREFSIAGDGAWQQWGAPTDTLGDTVVVMEEIVRALMEGELLTSDDDEETVCRHCERIIVKVDGRWIDPEATGDDAVWRETCDANDTFTSEHDPDTP